MATTVTLTVDDGQSSDEDTVDVTVVDIQEPTIVCVEAVNPAGKNVPPAGSSTALGTNPKGGKNPDGFYQVFARDVCDPSPEIWVGTAANPMLFGPFDSGIVIKVTEARGAAASMKKIGSASGQANAVAWHISLPTDAVVTAIDRSGNSASCTRLVPPPPKQGGMPWDRLERGAPAGAPRFWPIDSIAAVSGISPRLFHVMFILF